ncbi:oligogalacturonate-specific porin KdgM family protein [Aeromonas veronii]
MDKNWKPFFEIGNLREDRYSDNRQTRYRIGIKYTCEDLFLQLLFYINR